MVSFCLLFAVCALSALPPGPAGFSGLRGLSRFCIRQGCCGFSVHKCAGEVDTDSVGKRAQCLVRLFELLADREVLGTVLLTLAA